MAPLVVFFFMFTAIQTVVTSYMCSPAPNPNPQGSVSVDDVISPGRCRGVTVCPRRVFTPAFVCIDCDTRGQMEPRKCAL